ncbi:hypothetical protein QVD17_26443 [Tagetes erecta]|uniref:DUF4378 domain-containing protein n=1 Tax=Tagetes erecta TaxID=13708 RepID=A0AAD8NQU2_TARER|nr:hypothetical protein QVD17_26443 [Tagetes erecta]
MPQETLRSVVCRSFVTCEDPTGVIEGKTIRIIKTDSTKMSNRRTETQSKSSKDKEKMSLVEEKNGDQNLNEAIDLWSKGVGFKTQPKDIAKDLLKGTLDLQESLMMLGKLQEASRVLKFKKVQETPSEEIFSRNGSDRFESFQIYDSGYEKDRKLANGSSRDCLTELREVIKEGLSKQNLLLPKKSYQESAFSSTHIERLAGKRKLHLSPDMASTSSSTSSSMVYSTHEFTSSDSISSRATEEKSKGSNLIAKLMGLEEFPSKPPKKQLNISSKTRPVFDVDLPNAKKPQLFAQKTDQEHMSLDEIIKMMRSKRLLRSSKHEIKQSSKKFEDAAPIVLMRPRRVGLYPDYQKVKVYENPIRKVHQEKVKTEDKVVKSRGTLKSKLDTASIKQKASVPVPTKPQRKQEIEKKIDKIQKMASPIKNKTEEKAKSTNSISKNSSLKPQRSALPNQTLKRTYSSALSTNKSNNQKKNTKIEKTIIIHEAVQVDSPNQEETKDSEVTIEDIDNVRQKSPCEAFEKDSYRVTDANTCTDQSETRNNQEKNDVSDINELKARILKTIKDFQDPEPVSFELFQDCINEFLEDENQRHNPVIPRSILPSRVCISEDLMMRDIMKKIENLRNYSKFSNESCNADTVSGLLEMDLNLRTIGGVWSTIGWKYSCTVNEVEETVLDLEKMVLSKLIDDVLMELVSETRYAS